MDTHQLVDAQFDRAVEIVQSLPKNGPIQTDYEDKLTMYRYVAERFCLHSIPLVDPPLLTLVYTNKVHTRITLLKRTPGIDVVVGLTATVGNVTSERPSIYHMLERAKWCVSFTHVFNFALPPVYDITCQSRSDAVTCWAVSRCRDAWEKRKDLDKYEAKWRYVEALMKVATLHPVHSRLFDKTVG